MSTRQTETATIDGPRNDGWSASARPHGGEELPRLRLLYHNDLARIGAVSMPDEVSSNGDWMSIGRAVPALSLVGRGGARLPLEDPLVSREQLRVRWLPDARCFEVDPATAARRPVAEVLFDAQGFVPPSLRPIVGPTRFPPGTCIAIGDRVLLGLELGRTRSPSADRMGLVGESELIWALRDEVASVAPFGRPALVSGPTGAGKELVARALHQTSPRATGPFIAVNCAALPEKLVESVLFGHKKGAFTGAEATEVGLFRAADGGTLFLDELAELPLAIQPKLLRVLQDGVVVPVGAQEGKHVDLRIVAATHRDLESSVRAGALREDLYHRITAHVLRVPSLAERRFDVPELFVHALRRLRSEHASLEWLWDSGREWRQAIPIGFFAGLMGRTFHGNVRELQNVAERTARLNLTSGSFRAPDVPPLPPTNSMAAPATLDAIPIIPPIDSLISAADSRVPESLLRAAGDSLGVAHKTVLKLLPQAVLLSIGAGAGADTAHGGAPPDLATRLRARATEALVELLDAHDYNQSDVASALGTSRTTLIKLMDDLGLRRAMDLPLADITAALAQAGHDVDSAAKLLRVSRGALKRRIASLQSKT